MHGGPGVAASLLALATHADPDTGGTVTGFGIVPLICTGSWLGVRTMPRDVNNDVSRSGLAVWFLAGKVFFEKECR
ncbi:MAG: hypothetical protein Q8P67_08135 [archaeon]|nr:hypothetical protein [archaeon]